jgi:hypothetical protein
MVAIGEAGVGDSEIAGVTAIGESNSLSGGTGEVSL